MEIAPAPLVGPYSPYQFSGFVVVGLVFMWQATLLQLPVGVGPVVRLQVAPVRTGSKMTLEPVPLVCSGWLAKSKWHQPQSSPADVTCATCLPAVPLPLVTIGFGAVPDVPPWQALQSLSTAAPPLEIESGPGALSQANMKSASVMRSA